MSDKTLISIIHAAMKGDKFAAQQANDIFEDNGLDRVLFPELVLVHARKSGLGLMVGTENVIDNWITFVTPDQNNLMFYFELHHKQAYNWLDNANKWYEVCKKYNITINVPSPIILGFTEAELVGKKEVIDFFKKICSKPESEWF